MSSANNAPRVLVFLNGGRGLAAIEALVEAKVPVAGVVLQGQSSLAAVAGPLATAPVISLESMGWSGILEFSNACDPQIGLVAGFSRMVPSYVLGATPLGFLNLHAGELPKYRGGSPLNWAIINGDSRAGVSIVEMTVGIDDGRVVAAGSIGIEPTDTIADLHAKAIPEFKRLLTEVFSDVRGKLAAAKAQNEAEAVYWHQRSDSDGRILPWTQTAEQAERLVRAVAAPYPGAWIRVSGEQVRVHEAQVTKQSVRGTPGRLLVLAGQSPIMVMAEGSLTLTRWEAVGGHRLANGDYAE